eukprot:jgi/Ulvmu1/1507/UM011_0237.1
MDFFMSGQTSSWGAVFNLGNSAIGAGILAFPYAFQSAGLVGASLMCIVVAVLELGTMNNLIKAATAHRSLAYQSLVRSALGPAAGVVLSWTIFIYLTGSCVAFMMIAGDATHAMLQRFLFPHVELPLWAVTRWASVLLPAFLIILPLSMLQNIGALAPTSGLAVTAMSFTSATIAVKLLLAIARGTTSSGETIMNGVDEWNLRPAMLNAIPIMVFAYQCHVQAVPIYADLTASPSLLPCKSRMQQPSLARKCRGMTRVAALAFLECTVLYIMTGAAGYIQFPGKTDSNILSNYDIHDDLMQAARILVGAAATLHYPVDLHAARTALYDLACKYMGRDAVYPPPYPPIAAAAASMFCLTAAIACALTDLGSVFKVIGGLAGSVVIFVLPGAVMVSDPMIFEDRALRPAGQLSGDVAEQEVLLPAQARSSVVSSAQPGSENGSEAQGQPESHADGTQSLAVSDLPDLQSTPVNGAGRRLRSIQAWGLIYMCTGVMIMMLTVYLTVVGVHG